MSAGEELLALHLRAEKIPFRREVIFHPTRKWRFDFLIGYDLAVEVDGGNRMARIVKGRAVAVGRHGQDADMEKLNEAVLMGYRVLRFSPAMVKSGDAVAVIKLAINEDRTPPR